MGLALAGSFALTSCNDDKDEFSTDQYKGGINLNVWGPCPVARGGELRFLGSGMSQVTAITLPGCDKITDIKRISDEEVRITVPQNAEEGYVTVHTSQGDIITLTKISFLEPISLESITPLTVKPGQTLTLKGEYLNNIHEVIFSEDKSNADVIVEEDDFLSHTRQEISLVVPVEAKTGAIILSDANEEMPNWIISDEVVSIVLPAVDEILNLESVNPGDEITVKGTDLDLVIAVVMANNEDIDFTYTEGDSNTGSITFTIPENACNGPICFVTASCVEVVAVNIGECQPEDLVATPSNEIKGGNEIVITGKNLQMISAVSVPVAGGSTEVEFALTNNEKLTFIFPAEAQSGDVVLSLKGGGEVVVSLQTAKPEVMTNDLLPAGAETVLTGKNLDLLVSITFQGGSTSEVIEVSADKAKIIVPVTAQAGTAVLNMANGESSDWEANIAAPTGTYIVEGPGADDEVFAGEIVTFVIGNADVLKAVYVNGESVQYIVNGSNLYVNLPSSCGKGTIVSLESEDGSKLDYTYDFIPSTQVSQTIWTGMVDLVGWGEKIYLEKNLFEGVPAGAIMTFHLSAYQGIQIQINNANWNQLTMLEEWNDWADLTTMTLELTSDMLNNILTTDDGWSDNGMIIQGDGCVISAIDLAWENSREEAIWEGSWTNSGWGGNQDLAWGGFDWSTVKAGTVLRAYCTPIVGDGEWWCISFRHGDGWGNLPGDVGTQIDTPEGGVAEIVLTQEVLDDIIAGGGLVITGDGYTLTKVTLE